jgi:hypothetical protein
MEVLTTSSWAAYSPSLMAICIHISVYSLRAAVPRRTAWLTRIQLS